MARVLISMKDEFLDLIDEVAETEHRSRSELIREALRAYIRRHTPGTPTGKGDADISIDTFIE